MSITWHSLAADPGWWAVALGAVFLIGVTKSGFGSGVGLMIVPMMILAIRHLPGGDETAALGLLLPLLIAGDLVAIWQYRHLWGFSYIKKLLPSTAVGVGVGALLLALINAQRQQLAQALVCIDIGAESVVLVLLHWWRLWRLRDAAQPYVPKTWHNHAVGVSAGVSSTLAHAAGPIIAVYLLPQKLDRQRYVGACAIYFFMLNCAKFPFYALNGSFAHASPGFAMRFLPLVLCGAAVGWWLNRRMGDRWFSRIVYAATFVLGWYLLIDGVRALTSA